MFGAMLLVYVILGLIAFTLLLIIAQSERFVGLPALAAAAGGVSSPGPIGRRPLLEGGAAAGPPDMVRGLLGQTAAIAAVTLVVTALLFFFIPRWNIRNREVATNEPLRAVGFSKTITLGELGEVVQNPDVVMRVEFFRGHSRRPFKLLDEPLFRGSVVTHYDHGAWTQSQPATLGSLSTNTGAPYVRQRITVEPLDVSELFCVIPVFALQGDQRLRIDAGCQQLTRTEDNRELHLEFEVGTTGIVKDRQRKFLPCQRPLGKVSVQNLLQMPETVDGSSEPFAGLRKTAARVLADKDINPADRVATARALHEYLRYSGEFTYSLEVQPRDSRVDPLEDFVTEHRSGHCEYFAGALVMMLRSQGIPARMAIGFKGGEWNSLGMYYQVQQLHAHAWVEVYLDAQDVPAEAFAADDFNPPAAWLVLDPTVNVDEDSAAGQSISLWARVRQSLDYAQVLWSNYVVGLNAKRQRQGIYEPLEAGARAAAENLFGRETWSRRMRALAGSPVGTFWEWYRRHWFSWRGGLVAAAASLVIAACYVGALWLGAVLRRLRGANGAHEGPMLEMYRRLEAALARHGYQRHPAQTAYEFALVAGGDLAESIEHRRLSHLPRRVVEAFYRVRFGGRTLDSHEAEAVEHALGELERGLGRGRSSL
jgi:transglutaminase-like putative cysteine protease